MFSAVAALTKQLEDRYLVASEMRQDLRKVLSGGAVADFNQTESRQKSAISEIPQTLTSAPSLARELHDENETVVRYTQNIRQNEKEKSSKIWPYLQMDGRLV